MIFNTVTIFAAEPSTSVHEDTEVIAGINYSTEITSLPDTNSNPFSIDEIINNSTITVRGSSMEGTYESNKYNTGLTGYNFQISFDWKAGVNSSGDYFFSSISNAKITTYRDAFVCGMTWGYSHYEVTKNTYTISSNKKQVTFNTTYAFEYIMKNDPLAQIYTSTKSHKHTIILNNII